MKLRKLLTCLFYLGILLVVLGGCVSSADDMESPPFKTNGFPTGRLVREDGQRTFEFDEDGTWRIFYGESSVPAVGGRYGISGNFYTEMTHDYSGLKQIPATYTWTFDGEKLTFELWSIEYIPSRGACMDGFTYIKVE